MSTACRVRQAGALTLDGTAYRVQVQAWPWGAEVHLRRTDDGRLHWLRPVSPDPANGLREVVDVATRSPLTRTDGTAVLVELAVLLHGSDPQVAILPAAPVLLGPIGAGDCA